MQEDSSLARIFDSLIKKSGANAEALAAIAAIPFRSRDSNNALRQGAATERVFTAWRIFRQVVQAGTNASAEAPLEISDIRNTIEAYRRLQNSKTAAPSPTPPTPPKPTSASTALSPSPTSGFVYHKPTHADSIEARDIHAIFAYLRENAKLQQLSAKSGVQRAFLDLAILVPKGPARTLYIQDIQEVGFAASEYNLLSSRNRSEEAVERLASGWRAYLRARELPEANRYFDSAEIDRSLSRLRGRPPPPSVPATSPSSKIHFSETGLQDLEKLGLRDKADQLLQSYCGVDIQPASESDSIPPHPWTLLILKSRVTSDLHSRAFVAQINKSNDGSISLTQVNPAAQLDERVFWGQIAVEKQIRGKTFDLTIEHETGGQWEHSIQISGPVIAKIRAKHDVDINTIQQWIKLYKLGLIIPGKDNIFHYCLEPIDSRLPRLVMALNDADNGRYRILTIYTSKVKKSD